MSKTTSQENAVLDAGITGYWAAFSTLITEAGSGTEVTGTSYARVNLASLMASASGGAKASASEIAFPTSGAAWPTIKSFGLMDASSGGSVKRRVPCVQAWSMFSAATDGTFYVPGQSFSNSDIVVLSGKNLPGGVNSETEYYVVNSASGTLQLSLTDGGAAVTISTVGGGRIGELAPVIVNASGVIVRIPAGSLTFYED